MSDEYTNCDKCGERYHRKDNHKRYCPGSPADQLADLKNCLEELAMLIAELKPTRSRFRTRRG